MALTVAPTRADHSTTDHGELYVQLVRQRIQADNAVLREARRRRDQIRALAEQFDGALRTFNSGSLAHGTVNRPVKDADCGVVLDRRTWPELGPDGDGVGPADVVHEMASFIVARLQDERPSVRVTITKRAILFEFSESLGDEDPQENPSVDLVVALTRRDASGLWIPNLQAAHWDASDPERHTELLTAEPAPLRVLRARIVRLTKAAVRNDGEMAVLISWNIEALALDLVTEVGPSLLDGFESFLRLAAKSVALGPTLDPAGASAPIKLPAGISRDQAARRLSFFAECAAEAQRDRGSEARALAALGRIFPEQLPEAPGFAKDGLASAMVAGNASPAVAAAFGRPMVKSTRAYGDAAA
jgi:hypothetical protein